MEKTQQTKIRFRHPLLERKRHREGPQVRRLPHP